MSLEELKRVAQNLSTTALCEQAIIWASDYNRERESALQLICSALIQQSAELGRWLQNELLGLKPCLPPPWLSAAEMRILLPILHPTRDVIKTIMNRKEIDSDEALLLPVLLERLGRVDVVPLPKPSTEVMVRRRDWVRELAKLPGWEHWQLDKLTNQ